MNILAMIAAAATLAVRLIHPRPTIYSLDADTHAGAGVLQNVLQRKGVRKFLYLTDKPCRKGPGCACNG